MPVTAKLSRKFYETFGDDIANELVEWFNQVDATYRSDLRELNELNFARFDAKLEQRVGELRGDFERGLAELDTKLARRIAELSAKFDSRIAELSAEFESRIAELRAEFAKQIAELRAESAKQIAELRTESTQQLAALRVDVAESRASLIRWMLVFWAGTLIPIAGLVVALTR